MQRCKGCCDVVAGSRDVVEDAIKTSTRRTGDGGHSFSFNDGAAVEQDSIKQHINCSLTVISSSFHSVFISLLNRHTHARMHSNNNVIKVIISLIGFLLLRGRVSGWAWVWVWVWVC